MFIRLSLLQQKLDADSKAIQQINFTGNLDRAKAQQCFSVSKKQMKQFCIF